MLASTLAILASLMPANVADEYDRYFSQLDPARDVFVLLSPGSAVSGGEEESRRIAQAMLRPLRERIRQDVERIAISSVGALPADVPRDDVDGDGQVTGLDVVALRSRIWGHVIHAAPRALATEFELGGYGAPAEQAPATASSPGVLSSLARLLDDTDGDGIPAYRDNCADLYNPDQLNDDDDPLGNACDMDADGDSVQDTADQCPLDNRAQLDANGNGCADTACELSAVVPLVPFERKELLRSLGDEAARACSLSSEGESRRAANALGALAHRVCASSGHGISPEGAALLVKMAANAIALLDPPRHPDERPDIQCAAPRLATRGNGEDGGEAAAP